MSSKNKKDIDIKVSKEIKEEKNNSKNIIIIILSLIIIVLLIVLLYFIFFREFEKEDSKCSSVSIKEVEVEPSYQYINYQGFKFKMPLDWSFVSTDNKYEISNVDSSLLINMDYIDMEYDSFISSTYQKKYLESLQTSLNVKIKKTNEQKKKDVSYYLFEGTKDSYDFAMVAVGDTNRVILVEVQFQDKASYDKYLDSVIDFSISSQEENTN